MLESSLVYIITRTFPESLILVLSGVVLLGINIDRKRVFKDGIILGIIIAIIRLLPITFGVHSILSMIFLCIILFKYPNNDIVESMVSTCLVWISVAISECIYVLIATSLLNIKVENLMDNTTLQGAIITLPSLLIMFLIVLLLKYIKNNLLKFKLRG
ncbi:hypothetical protein [Romboutsia timonensis]|uniref:hypothetical protein n=1 Tax=Romboutsia timonensis TaxID=1776391 RepID=UPI002A8240C9|nr:hypothetical protein [Romboutsia timonensis]MDY3958126.1 hypothetical protein [Romboutsia timonensis]